MLIKWKIWKRVTLWKREYIIVLNRKWNYEAIDLPKWIY